jgi:NCS1 family nucleobase:cation symporter-1
MSNETFAALERHSIEHVPENERHGRPRNLFTLWFASNVNISSVVTGALAVYVGLDLTWAIISILAGNLIGGVFMAYHSVQGPRMGVPQMIQSRAQFGAVGAVLPMLITVVMYLGFQTEGGIVLGKALAAKTGLPLNISIILFGVVGISTALFGYNLIHSLSKLMTIVCGAIFAAFFFKLVFELGSAHAVNGHSTWQHVLLAISLSVSWQITWAPYVSDYSRYLPQDTPGAQTFWFTYVGSVLTASATMMIGAFGVVVGGDAFGANPLGYLTGQFSAAGTLLFWMLLIFGFGGASGPYGAFLTAFAAISSRGVAAASTPRVRAVFVIGFVWLSTALSIAASEHLLATFQNVTVFLLYLLVPWTAINLMDYFVIRRGHYDLAQLFVRNGIYGMVNWRALTIYLAAIGIQVPFINSSLYEGPIAKSLNGADIAWIVGLTFSAVAYYLVAKRDPSAPKTLTRRTHGSRDGLATKSKSAQESDPGTILHPALAADDFDRQ